jgi:hypothetical protein
MPDSDILRGVPGGSLSIYAFIHQPKYKNIYHFRGSWKFDVDWGSRVVVVHYVIAGGG